MTPIQQIQSSIVKLRTIEDMIIENNIDSEIVDRLIDEIEQSLNQLKMFLNILRGKK